MERVDVGGALRPDHQVRASRPGVDPLRELQGRGHVVVEHGPPLGEGVQALPRHVALHSGDAERAVVGVRRRAVHRGGGEHHGGDAGGEQGGDPTDGGAPQVHDRPGERRTDQGDEVRRAGRAHVGERRGHRGVHGGERQPSPREPAEGDGAAQQLDPDPHRRRPQRPPAQPRHEGGADAAEAVEHRLEQRQRDPGVGADHPQPWEQHQHEGDSEGRPDAERGAKARPPHRQGEPGDRHRQQVRPVERLERQRREQAGGSGHGEPDGQGGHRTNLSSGRSRHLRQGAKRARDPSDRLRFRWLRKSVPLSTGQRAHLVSHPALASRHSGTATPRVRGTRPRVAATWTSARGFGLLGGLREQCPEAQLVSTRS